MAVLYVCGMYLTYSLPQRVKFPGWKVLIHTRANSMFDGPITNPLSVLCILIKVLSCAHFVGGRGVILSLVPLFVIFWVQNVLPYWSISAKCTCMLKYSFWSFDWINIGPILVLQSVSHHAQAQPVQDRSIGEVHVWETWHRVPGQVSLQGLCWHRPVSLPALFSSLSLSWKVTHRPFSCRIFIVAKQKHKEYESWCWFVHSFVIIIHPQPYNSDTAILPKTSPDAPVFTV